MSNKCPKCKAANPGSATFCADCGTQLPSIENIDVTETIETPKEELTTGSTFAGRYQVIEELGKSHTEIIRTAKSLPRKDYLGVMKMASVMLGNSSSGIIEAPAFGLPVVNIGTRQMGRERGSDRIKGSPC